jgi:hypothetical protein
VTAHLEERLGNGSWRARTGHPIRAAAGSILEVAIPFRELGVEARDAVAFIVTAGRAGSEPEQHPRHRPIEIVVPGEEFPVRAWTA